MRVGKKVVCDYCFDKPRAIVRIRRRKLLNPRELEEVDLCGRHFSDIEFAILEIGKDKVIKVYDREKFRKICEKVKRE